MNPTVALARRPHAGNRPSENSGIGTADDPWWLESFPDELLEAVEQGPEARYDARESIALSFIAGLQQLPAQQRSVLVLRDVLGFPASEVADILATTTASVNSALIRARGGFRPERNAGPRTPATFRGGSRRRRPLGRCIPERRSPQRLGAPQRRCPAVDAARTPVQPEIPVPGHLNRWHVRATPMA